LRSKQVNAEHTFDSLTKGFLFLHIMRSRNISFIAPVHNLFYHPASLKIADNPKINARKIMVTAYC